jgi:hypothetical protein
VALYRLGSSASGQKDDVVMDIQKAKNGKWMIIHAGKFVNRTFETEEAAWTWADSNIDDQVFDGPNCLAPPIVYVDQNSAGTA